MRFENLVSSSSGLDDLLSRHSIFERLQRSVAWLLRFKTFLRWKYLRHDKPETGFLTVNELETSSRAIFRLVQSRHFGLEIKCYDSDFFSRRGKPKGEFTAALAEL